PVSGCRDFLRASLLPHTLVVRVRSVGNLETHNQRISHFRFQLWTFLSDDILIFEVILSLFLFPQHHSKFNTCCQEAVVHHGNGCQK
ncbi:hypothetical protein EV363DRAFT_1091204, partial [Boletus edulis]